jgi:hypothetical protein
MLSKTENRMTNFNKRFDRMTRFVNFFIGFVFLLIICYFVVIGVIAYKGIDTAMSEDWSNGIKPVVEKLWCGKPGCM